MTVAKMLRAIVKHATAAVALTQNEIKYRATEKTLQSTVNRAAAAVSLKPTIGQGTDTTTVRLRNGTQCDIEEGSWQVVADLEPELGGSDEHPGPGFLLRAAMGTCFAQTAALWAAKWEVPIDHLEVEVEANHDARGLLGVDDTPARFTALRCKVTAESPAPKEDVQRVLDAAKAHSPVRHSVEHDFTVEDDTQIVAPQSQ